MPTQPPSQTRAEDPAARRAARGFTMIEMMVTVMIAGVIASLGYASWRAAHRRSQLSSYALEVQTALLTARAKALSSGRDVDVLFYPQQPTGGGGLGRIVVFVDGDGGFMSGSGAGNFCNFKPNVAAGATSTKSEILTTIDLPRGLSIGPSIALPGIQYPFTTVPSPAATGCTFCDDALTAGGVRFDPRGQASFYKTCGTAIAATGGAISLNSVTQTGAAQEITGSSFILILPSGLVRSFHAG